jgi:hypothetical protein
MHLLPPVSLRATSLFNIVRRARHVGSVRKGMPTEKHEHDEEDLRFIDYLIEQALAEWERQQAEALKAKQRAAED